MGNALAFLLLLCYGKRYLTLSLFFHFYRYLIDSPCTHTTEDSTYPKQASYKASGSQCLSSAITIITLVLLILLSGDVHPNPGPPLNDNSISIVHNNICSLENKLSLVEAELGSYDIITISETWLHNATPNKNILISGYQPPIRRDREGHGGVAIYVKEDLICIHRPDLEVDDLEAVWIESKLNQETILIGCFYRPPSSRVGYWDLVDQSIDKAGSSPHKLVILGDFNTDKNSNLPYDVLHTRYLNRIMHLNNLVQLINEPTRHTDNTAREIDLILTTCPGTVKSSGVRPTVKSDHCCVYVNLKCNIPRRKTFKRTIYCYDKIDPDIFKNKLLEIEWNEIISNDSIEDAALSFTEKLLNSAKECMPSKTITIKENDAPWMSEEIRKLMDKKLKIHSFAKRLDSLWCWDLFKVLRNRLTSLIRKRKDEHLREMEDRINTPSCFGSKDWWKLLNRFTSRKGISQSCIPPIQNGNIIIYSDKDKADVFNTYFLDQARINNPNDDVPDVPPGEHVLPDLIISSAMVRDIIVALDSNKAVGPDGIHNKVLKKAVDVISEPLAILFNRSLERNTFPAMWKKAHVTPIHKKGEKHFCNNYRPISLLSCIGKVMERCVHGHIFKFLIENSLLTVSQSGFIPKDSTTFQLLTIYDDFCKALNDKITTQAIFFDISKAFDRVWHQGLIRKCYAIGIRGTLLDWLRNYLTDRYQAVVIKGEKSSYKLVQAGVPQGSVLGPLLFLIYINDIVKGIDSIIKLFADDTSIYLSLDDVQMRTEILNSDMKKITDWSTKWKVDFHPGKTELITLSSKRAPELDQLTFGNVVLDSKTEHKHLGVIIQNDCKWDEQINQIISKVRLQVSCLRSFKYKLSRRTLEIMYKSYILPHFDYADTVWDNCTQFLSDELEKYNLDAIRTIIGAVRGTSHHKLYNESGILPLTERRRRHKLILFFKMTKNMTPNYLTDYLPPLVTDTNPYHLRNILERKPPRSRTELYEKSFFPSTTELWNDLPDFTKTSSSIAQFKRHLSENDVTVPPFYFATNRKAEIIHCKLRLEISDLNSDLYKRHLTGDMSCLCGSPIENAHHYLVECPLFDQLRLTTINQIPNFPHVPTKQLTNGSADKSLHENYEIFEKVQDFITLSGRFP